MKSVFPPAILKILPYFSLIVGIFALGMTAVFIRWANAPATITGFYRLSITSIILFPFFIWKNSKNKKVNRANLIFPILGGLFTAFDFAFWNTAVLFTTASNATLLGNTAPIWVALVTILIFRKRLPREFWIGLLLALSGAALVLGSDFLLHPRLGLGDLLALIAGIFYAAYLLSTQIGRETLDPLSYMTIMVFSASIVSFFINLFLGLSFSGYSRQSWLIFLLLSLVSQILGYTSISYALGHLPASVVAPSMIGQPILTTLLAIPLLGEFPRPFQILGGCIALAGIYLIHNSHKRDVSQSTT
jgi:drug/metabolite transporter (DMT)-like permease